VRKDGPPTGTHRVVAVVAALSLLFELNAVWRAAAGHSASGTVAAVVGFPLVLAWAGAALAARTTRGLVRFDLLGLAVAAAGQLGDVVGALRGRSPLVVDETVLCHLAARALATGHDPYAGTWPEAVAQHPTLLMNGGIADRFDYPPLSAVVAAGVHRVLPGAIEVAVVGWAALLATAVLLHRWLSVALRPLAVLACFSLSPLPVAARYGYPLMLAMPLLLVGLRRWPELGLGGRLGRAGGTAGIALGLAAATQQFTWFLLPFLAAMLWRRRAADLGEAGAARVVLRLAAVLLGAFAVVNLPFVVAGPSPWWRGVLDPLRQHAFFNGPGVANLSLHALNGSGALDFYRYAGLAFFVTGLAVTVLCPDRVGPAALLLPCASFWLVMRAEVLYLEAFVPVGLLLVATSRPDDFAAARPVPLPRAVRVALPAVLGAGVAAALGVAALWPAPLRAAGVTVALRRATGHVDHVEVRMTNRSGHALRPHFASQHLAGASLYWRVARGRSVLPPDASSTYVLLPPPSQAVRIGDHADLYVVTDDPQTLTVVHLPGAR
jgi:hypothetical protein